VTPVTDHLVILRKFRIVQLFAVGGNTLGIFRLVRLLVIFTIFGTQFAAAEKRVALVIGNSDYSHVPKLANSANDARLIADTLKSAGFNLIGNSALIDRSVKAGLHSGLDERDLGQPIAAPVLVR
jgi:hypothetical protein